MPRRDLAEVKLFADITKNWQKYSVRFLLVSKEQIPLDKEIEERCVHIINDYQKLEKVFGVRRYGISYILNKSGDLLYRGNTDKTYEEEMKGVLNQLVLKKYFNIEYFLPSSRKIRELNWMNQINSIENRDSKYRIIIYFTSLCSSCLSGNIINIIKNALCINNSVCRLIMVFKDAGNKDNEIELMKAQLGLQGVADIYIADDTLRAKWQELIDDFSEAELSNIVVIIDKEGNIVRTYYRNCSNNCWKKFVNDLAGLQ